MSSPATSVIQALAAGATSVTSTCFLPVLPVLLAGAGFRGKLRPVLLAAGLAVAFLVMGVVSSLWGGLLVGRTRTLEIAGTTIIALVGLAGLCAPAGGASGGRCAWASGLGAGAAGGAVLGLALGPVWVPCIGPVLSGILNAVATPGQLPRGVFLLAFYSLGLAFPLLAVTFTSYLVQRGSAGTPRRETALRVGATVTLSAFWLYQILHGNIAF